MFRVGFILVSISAGFTVVGAAFVLPCWLRIIAAAYVLVGLVLITLFGEPTKRVNTP